MANNIDEQPERAEGRRHTWPWFVLGGVVLGIALAVAWMSREVARTRHIRELSAPEPQTNSAAAVPRR